MKTISLLLFVIFSFTSVSLAKSITQNIYSQNDFRYILTYSDSSNTHNFILEISKNYKEFLKDSIENDSSIYPYTFTLNNLNDLFALNNELNRALKVILDTNDVFPSMTANNVSLQIQLATNQETDAERPLAGELILYNKEHSIEVKLCKDCYIKGFKYFNPKQNDSTTINEFLIKSYINYITNALYYKHFIKEIDTLKTKSKLTTTGDKIADIKRFHDTLRTYNLIKKIPEPYLNNLESLFNMDHIDRYKINTWIYKLFTETNISFMEAKSLKFSEKENSKITFENGSIADITIALVNNDLPLYKNNENIVFTNRVPIGFSTKQNYKQLNDYYLFDFKYGIYNIKLSDVLKYHPTIDLYTRDYSPADTSITFNKNSDSIFLKKKKSNNLLNIVMYSDFVGIGENKGNGLIQAEIDYKINTHTFYKQFRNRTIANKENSNSWVGGGKFTHLIPYIAVTKIEKNGRNLALSTINTEKTKDSLPYAETLNFLEYNNFKAGFEFNYFELIISKLKLNIVFNGALEFGRTSVAIDSQIVDTSTNIITLTDNFGINTTNIKPFIIALNFFPENRFRFDMSYSLGLLFILSDKVGTVYNATDLTKTTKNNFKQRMYHTVELKARYKIKNIGFMFARYRLNFQNNIKAANFHQAQVGISLNMLELFSRN